MTALPENTKRMLYKSGSWKLPGDDNEECKGAKFHSPRPLFTQATMLVLREWWPDDGPGPRGNEHAFWAWAPKADLCGTCRDNLSILLQMLHATHGELEWSIRREFGNDLRALAQKGWAWFEEHGPANETTGITSG